MNVKKNILETIGGTPLVELTKIGKDSDATIYAKVESFNPGGSVKDRIALNMIETARKEGLINDETVIVEPTSGNTGVGLALVAAYYGNRLIIVMPETMSVERRNLVQAYGAELVLTPGAEGMKGAIAKAQSIVDETPNSFMPLQFNNESNPAKHYESTGIEIFDDLDGDVDVLVSGIGTGGTITGAGKYLKEKLPNLHVVAVEPTGSPVLSKGEKGPHKIQGIGAGFIPEVLDTDIYDEVITVSDEDAFAYGKRLAREEGILAGISSGAALVAASEIANRPEFKGKKIVVILPDTGERYLTTDLFK